MIGASRDREKQKDRLDSSEDSLTLSNLLLLFHIKVANDLFPKLELLEKRAVCTFIFSIISISLSSFI